jgi:hypothetical protein
MHRSVEFAALQPLFQTFGAHIVSIQKGRPEEQAQLAAAHIFDADLLLKDFADTAALMANLDLIISVDTAAVHLAGAMNIPAWLMLPFEPEWRWMHGREDSPWYPSLRLFRQTSPREWQKVIATIISELQKLMAGEPVLQPKRWAGEPLRQNPHALKLECMDDG